MQSRWSFVHVIHLVKIGEVHIDSKASEVRKCLKGRGTCLDETDVLPDPFEQC